MLIRIHSHIPDNTKPTNPYEETNTTQPKWNSTGNYNSSVNNEVLNSTKCIFLPYFGPSNDGLKSKQKYPLIKEKKYIYQSRALNLGKISSTCNYTFTI